MTLPASQDVLGDSLAVTLTLPIEATDRPADPAAATRLLELIALIEDNAADTRGTDPPPAGLARLEAKLDLLLLLLAGRHDGQRPAMTSLRLSATGLQWPAGALPVDCPRVALYPCTWLPQPMVLDLESPSECGEWHGARWATSDAALREALQRWIFRVHRRAVAKRRQPDALG